MLEKISSDNIIFTEQSFIKAPYERYRKQVRISQKELEKDLSNFLKLMNELKSESLQKDERTSKFELLLSKINILKEKVNHYKNEELNNYSICYSRISHLDKGIASNTADANIEKCWLNIRLNRLIADYLLREGFLMTASALSNYNCANVFDITVESFKILQEFVDFDMFKELHYIEECLDLHSCMEALNWLQDAKKGSFKPSVSLEFDLKLQEFIELIRNRNYETALIHAKKAFGPFYQSHTKDINIAMALLAIPSSTKTEPYRSYFAEERWKSIKDKFRFELFALYHASHQSLLVTQLQAGLSALKTPFCYDNETKNINCPVCSPLLGQLAKELPYSHRETSCMVCHLSGQIINENNPPMCLPNGHVYSYQALKKLAESNNGIIICPKTGLKCGMSDLRKMYIL